MNPILHLSAVLKGNPYTGGGPIQLPGGQSVSLEKLKRLQKNLQGLLTFWEGHNEYIPGALIEVEYIKIVAKSRRIQGFFSMGGDPSNKIVGAKFKPGESSEGRVHVVTYYISLDCLKKSIAELGLVLKKMNHMGLQAISNNEIGELKPSDFSRGKTDISKSKFIKYIVDSYYVNKFNVPNNLSDVDYSQDSYIVNLFNVNMDTRALLSKIGIHLESEWARNTEVLLKVKDLEKLVREAGYLVSMHVKNYADYCPEDYEIAGDCRLSIPDPQNEPIIGVIDSFYSKDVYFNKWVEYIDYDSRLKPTQRSIDEEHGTKVASILVDGPAINKRLEDGCGRFRVRLFNILKGNRIHIFTVMRDIRRIVRDNPDIKVWNLSLGAVQEVSQNYISPVAAMLDELQSQYDVIFIIAGTNDSENTLQKRIGEPADSLNSIVVNSVKSNGESASYTRMGPVLSFFTKPDVCYYGGDFGDEAMLGCTRNGAVKLNGTSYAAPWITRKVAFLIYKLGLSREIAKALIIDSAYGWNSNLEDRDKKGAGIVPVHINDIVKCAEDEIKFYVNDELQGYETYAYNIPVPRKGNKYPYVAKATLCYFPECNRNQGVDYTDTELDLMFGRVKKEENKKGEKLITIKSINKNKQGEKGDYTKEEEARLKYRKWDNVKHVSEVFTGKNRGKKVYSDSDWGISIKIKERLKEKHPHFRFGLVVTLKAFDGDSRLNQFVQNCEFGHYWHVRTVDVESRINVYEKASQEIEWDE